MQPKRRPGRGRRWSHGVPIEDRGPSASYRPDDVPPSLFAAHQPGVTTPLLDHVAFAALDITAQREAELRDLMGELTVEGERLMSAARQPSRRGRPAGTLTLTIGLGPWIFGERFGLASQRPVALTELPPFPGDALDPATSGGDVCIQVCAADRRAADGALSRLLTVAQPTARMRWSQRGSLHRLPGDPPSGRPRNLLGFKDATSNPRRGRDLDRHVWVTGRERTWMVGGTFLVVRRVRILLDAWNALSLDAQ